MKVLRLLDKPLFGEAYRTFMAEQEMKNRVIFITGGNSGIGLETALRFAEEGAHIAIFSRREKQNMIARNQIIPYGVECLTFSGNVTREGEVKLAIQKTVDKLGRLDYAFNNAGLEQFPNPIFQQSEKEFQTIMDVNLKGVWLCMKHELPYIVQSGGGVIVNNASVTGIVATDMVAAFVAAKHGVVGLSKAAALEYIAANVRVNAICPAGVETPMLDRLLVKNPAARTDIDAYHPIGRCATAREIAEAVYWLCSPKSSFVTGHALVIDGGASIR